MPEIGQCTHITCDNEIKELYKCHCCLRLICLYHLNIHAEITKQNNNRRLDNLRNELNTVVNTLKLIVEEKLLTIEHEQNLIKQAKKFLDISSSSIDELQNIFEKINQTIALNRLGIMLKVEPSLSQTKYCSRVSDYNKENMNSNDEAEELKISKDDEYSTDIDHHFDGTVSLNERIESIQNQYVNEKEGKHKLKSYRYIFNTCPLTFDGAYGLTKANHSIKFCEHETTRRIELYFHFTRKHQLKKLYAQRLVQAIANNQDPHITKLFNENEDVLDHFYKVQCPFVYGNVNTLNNSRRKVNILPCQHRLVVLYKLKHHLRATHKISNSLAQKLTSQFFPNPILHGQVLTSGIPLSSPSGTEPAWEHELGSAKTLRERSMKRKQQDKDLIDKKFNLTIRGALDEKEVDDNLINIDRALSGSNHSNSSIHSHYNNNHYHQTNNNSRHTNNLPTNDHIDSRSRRHLHDFFSDTQYNNRNWKEKSSTKDNQSISSKTKDVSSFKRN
ncbi:unnamed protein product [Rotaria sordida]|uniref:Uncharacterized protein n=1 Tax=Rotaria sordida TaxID=392033 RepID=A0A815FRS3_9BILA|nr:unnamed protein product [Rotaria sordida]CAF1589755.1 unnamed protein product [Rotaria sordida]